MSNWNKIKNSNEEERQAYFDKILVLAEPCESFSQSIYVNEKGIIYPCSFMEKMPWNSLDYNDSEGWDLLSEDIKDPKDFLDKVWNSAEAIQFSTKANMCAACGNGCQVYNV